MIRLLLLFCVFLVSCGKKIIKGEEPLTTNQQLVQEIDRIEKLLVWCAGFPAREVTSDCDGDGATYHGFVSLMSKSPINEVFWSKIIDEVGTPYRNANRVKNDNLDAFSRDQLLGVMEASTVSPVAKETLKKIWSYYEHTGKLCEPSSDNRCDMATSMVILKKDIFNEKVTTWERQVDETTIRAEGLLSPEGYQTFLPVRKIMLHAKTNSLTQGYVNSFNAIYNKYPLNLYNRTVHTYLNKLGEEKYEEIKKDLIFCMKQFEKPSVNANWGWDRNVSCPLQNGNVWGHDLVALGKFLNQM